jgi:hypothetical protein
VIVFPLGQLQPKVALLSDTADEASLDILIAPFTFESRQVDPSIRLGDGARVTQPSGGA